MKPEEQCVVKKRYGKCDGLKENSDLVFCYPQGEFSECRAKHALEDAAGQWQEIRCLTDVNPTTDKGFRVVVGYRHPDDEDGKDCDPGYGKECGVPFINIPWEYLGHDNEPAECLSHELVHAFADVKQLKDKCKLWTEGMCDFLRLFALRAIGQAEPATRMEKEYRSRAWKMDGNYADYAGRLLRWCDVHKVDSSNQGAVKCAVAYLWDSYLSTILASEI